jgi:hypothetical protein
VVSKEEVAVRRKGGGGTWGSGGRPATMGQPRQMVEYEHWQKNKQRCRSSGCRLQFGGAENGLLTIRLQNLKTKTLFSAALTSNSRCLVFWSKEAMRVIFVLFWAELPGTAPSRCILKPQDPHSSGPWTPGAPAEVLTLWQELSLDVVCSRGGGPGPHTAPAPEAP